MDRIERFYLWSAVAVYFVVWVSVLSLGFRPALLPLAVVTGLAFAGAYARELAAGGHCYLCADPRTLPVAGAVYLVGVAVYFAAGWLVPAALGWLPPRASRYATTTVALGAMAGLFSWAVMAGHLTAIAYSALADAVLRRIFRGPDGARGDSPAPPSSD